MDRFASITAFVRVAESGGFSAGGRRLNLSKATVSDQVQVLENALGVRLLNRTTRRVSLTEIGREYYERCVQILHYLEEADEAANAPQLSPHGQLRVFCHHGVSRFVAPIANRFLARYPEASVDLRTGDLMIDLVQEGFDLAITALPPPGSTLIRRRLAAGRCILCCSPAYLEKHPAPRCPEDLAGHNCLRYTYAPFGDRWPFLDAGGNSVFARVSCNLLTTCPETLRAAVIAGTGIALVPSFVILDLLISGALVPLLPNYRAPEFELVAVYPHRRHVTAKVRAFIDMLVDRFGEHEHPLGPSGS